MWVAKQKTTCQGELIPSKFDNKPWVCSQGRFAGLIFGGAYFQRGLLLQGILYFKMGWAWQYKKKKPKTLQ